MVLVAKRVVDLFQNAKNPSLTLRVSFGFPTILAWSIWAKGEERDVISRWLGAFSRDPFDDFASFERVVRRDMHVGHESHVPS